MKGSTVNLHGSQVVRQGHRSWFLGRQLLSLLYLLVFAILCPGTTWHTCPTFNWYFMLYTYQLMGQPQIKIARKRSRFSYIWPLNPTTWTKMKCMYCSFWDQLAQLQSAVDMYQWVCGLERTLGRSLSHPETEKPTSCMLLGGSGLHGHRETAQPRPGLSPTPALHLGWQGRDQRPVTLDYPHQ